MERIVVTYSADPQLLRAAAKVLAPKAPLWGLTLAGVAIGVVVVVLLELAAGVSVTTGHFVAASVGAACVLIAFYAVTLSQMRQVVADTVALSALTGSETATFDAEGLTFRTALSESAMSWRTVLSISEIEGGTGLRVGSMLIAIPDSALTDVMTPKVFRDRIATWWEAAR